MTVTFVPADSDAASAPRVAFAISRHVGNAVVRNRLRRRMRSVMLQLDRSQTGLVPGAYLLTVRPEAAGLSHTELAGLVTEACAASGARPAEEPAR